MNRNLPDGVTHGDINARVDDDGPAMNHPEGTLVRMTAGQFEGEEGYVVGVDERHGENVVELADDGAFEAIVPEDGLEVLDE